MITSDYIRDLCGLSSAELPSQVIDNLLIIPKVKLAAEVLFTSLEEFNPAEPTQTAIDQLDYMGYKAITLLKSYILTSVPQTIKDNYNSFTRFDTIKDMLELAESKVATFEGYTSSDSILLVVRPATDPVADGE